MNSVTLIGNVATDVDFKQLNDDKRVANFLLAVDRGENRGADYLRIVAWDKDADACARSLAKGSRAEVNGRLRSRSYEDAEGKRRNVVEVVVTKLEPLAAAVAADTPFEAATAR